MKTYRSAKPVRKCHNCLLNLGDHCWIYQYPRGQWQNSANCPGRDDAELHEKFRTWQKQPDVKTLKELRRDYFRSRRKKHPHRRRPARHD